MVKFRDVETEQKSAAVHASIHNRFNHQRISTAATFSNKTEPPPWPSGVNEQPEGARLQVLQVLSC